jgi:thiol-disulfide isomerase/thioredoxin
MRLALAAFVALSLFVCMAPSIGRTESMPAGDVQPFPSYGSGKVMVRLYTDYFCPPCRAMEPTLEPVIQDLVKRNIIQLTFVDTPIYPASPEYARYFLYALNKKTGFEHALRVRQVLFRAAEEKLVEKEKLEDRLKTNGIGWLAFDTKLVFQKLNVHLKEDDISSTPSVVIVNKEKKETFKGSKEIIPALQLLK